MIIDDTSNEKMLGVYRGLVAENVDPELAGRVKVTTPADAGGETLWAPVASIVSTRRRPVGTDRNHLLVQRDHRCRRGRGQGLRFHRKRELEPIRAQPN